MLSALLYLLANPVVANPLYEFRVLREASIPTKRRDMNNPRILDYFSCGEDNRCYDLGHGMFTVHYLETDSCRLIDSFGASQGTLLVSSVLEEQCRSRILAPFSRGQGLLPQLRQPVREVVWE